MNPEQTLLEKRVVDELEQELQTGELYLFTPIGDNDRESQKMWAIFAEYVDGGVWLETATNDFKHFRHWSCLPEGWRCYRRATRDELRDYAYSLAIFELTQER
ncbi:MAG: hypothetical protein IIX66_05165 [Alistipes sp.]|nr:hypothetical protein [Alistipes sp.]